MSLEEIIHNDETVPVDVDLMIAVPSTDSWQAQFGMSLSSLLFYAGRISAGKGIKNQRVRTLNRRSSLLCQSRESILAEAISCGCTHLLMLDSDMVFPEDTLQKLFRHNRTFVGANYVRKMIPSMPVTASLDGKLTFTDPLSTGIEEVQHIGLGCCLLRLDDVKDIPEPWFSMEWNETLGCYSGEDVYFCKKLAEHGIPIYVDHDLSQEVQHVGVFNYDHTIVGEVVEELDDGSITVEVPQNARV